MKINTFLDYDLLQNLPTISVIMPSFNQKKFIERSILSIVNQFYPKVELIIIDGGSTDGTVEVLEKYNKYIKYWVSEKDTGQSNAFNKGAKIATGELIGWQNSDDLYLYNCFWEVANEYMEHVKYDVYFSNMLLIDDNDNVITDIKYVPFSVDSLIYEGWNITNQSAFWSRDLFRKIGYFDEDLHYGMDFDWFVRVGLSGARFKYINKSWGAFRVYGGTKTDLIAGTVGKNDYEKIYKKNNIVLKHKKVKRIISVIRRVIYYIKYGDYSYVWRGIKRMIVK